MSEVVNSSDEFRVLKICVGDETIPVSGCHGRITIVSSRSHSRGCLDRMEQVFVCFVIFGKNELSRSHGGSELGGDRKVDDVLLLVQERLGVAGKSMDVPAEGSHGFVGLVPVLTDSLFCTVRCVTFYTFECGDWRAETLDNRTKGCRNRIGTLPRNRVGRNKVVQKRKEFGKFIGLKSMPDVLKMGGEEFGKDNDIAYIANDAINAGMVEEAVFGARAYALVVNVRLQNHARVLQLVEKTTES
jgi:hypothetical protein